MNALIQENGEKDQNTVLVEALGSPRTCPEAIAYCEELLKAISTFNARLLGRAGARAVLTREISLAVPEAPLVQKIVPNNRAFAAASAGAAISWPALPAYVRTRTSLATAC